MNLNNLPVVGTQLPGVLSKEQKADYRHCREIAGLEPRIAMVIALRNCPSCLDKSGMITAQEKKAIQKLSNSTLEQCISHFKSK